MRISDWSSDVCSSDLTLDRGEKSENAKGKVVERPGVSQEIADRVYARLLEKGYIDDEKFTRFWVENRNQAKGTSRRKLTAELRAKEIGSASCRERVCKYV